MSDANKIAMPVVIESAKKAEEVGKIGKEDFDHFTRIFGKMPRATLMKYADGFTPPKDHDEWVKQQIYKTKRKGASVRETIKETIEELTEERAFFEGLDGRLKQGKRSLYYSVPKGKDLI